MWVISVVGDVVTTRSLLLSARPMITIPAVKNYEIILLGDALAM